MPPVGVLHQGPQHQRRAQGRRETGTGDGDRQHHHDYHAKHVPIPAPVDQLLAEDTAIPRIGQQRPCDGIQRQTESA